MIRRMAPVGPMFLVKSPGRSRAAIAYGREGTKAGGTFVIQVGDQRLRACVRRVLANRAATVRERRTPQDCLDRFLTGAALIGLLTHALSSLRAQRPLCFCRSEGLGRLLGCGRGPRHVLAVQFRGSPVCLIRAICLISVLPCGPDDPSAKNEKCETNPSKPRF